MLYIPAAPDIAEDPPLVTLILNEPDVTSETVTHGAVAAALTTSRVTKTKLPDTTAVEFTVKDTGVAPFAPAVKLPNDVIVPEE